MTESNPILDKYMSLDQGERVQVLYVWIDGTGESMRCKTKTVEEEPMAPEDLPIWNFDGSSCYQAEGCNSDVYLHPVALFRDPFRRGKSKIALCETYNFDHKPGVSNHRSSCLNAMENEKVKVCNTFVIHSYMTRSNLFRHPAFLVVVFLISSRPQTRCLYFILPCFFFLGLSPGKFRWN